jgi:transposase InsO family protein
LNRKTVRKWRGRDFVHEAPMGPKAPRSTVLTPEEEAMVVAFRKHTLLPRDDCLYALQATIPHLTRSALHRCFQRHGISRLPEIEGDKTSKKAFRRYPLGYFYIDIAEVRTEDGKLHLLRSRGPDLQVRLRPAGEAHRGLAARTFLDELVATVPYKIHTLLTDNGIQFADLPRNRNSPTAMWRGHPFDRACHEHGIEHRLTKPNHPWTNGQVERMNRTLKVATVRRYHYETHQQLKDHLAAFLDAYNFAKRLKALRGHLKGLGGDTEALHPRSSPLDLGTEHLAVYEVRSMRPIPELKSKSLTLKHDSAIRRVHLTEAGFKRTAVACPVARPKHKNAAALTAAASAGLNSLPVRRQAPPAVACAGHRPLRRTQRSSEPKPPARERLPPES